MLLQLNAVSVSPFISNAHMTLILQSALIINSFVVCYAVPSKAEYTQVLSTGSCTSTL